MKSKYIKPLIALFLLVPGAVVGHSQAVKASNDALISPLRTNNRSYFFSSYFKSSKPTIYYVDPRTGYRGYLSLVTGANGTIVGDSMMYRYEGILYHPNVKNIPAPAKINPGLELK